jgi:single-strand DNA-binding protein
VSNNLVILQGNLGGDVEVRHTGTGKAVANLSIAVNSGYGEKKTTAWFRVTAWEGLAEQAQQNLTKGSEVTVIGRLQNSKKKQKSGEEIWVTEVVATSLGYSQQRAQAAIPEASQEIDDNDIPF